MYLGWFDDDGKKAVEEKIREGADAYRSRFKEMPDVCLVSQADFDAAQTTSVEGVQLIVKPYMSKHNFWIGMEAR